MTRDWFTVVAGPIAWFAALVADWMLAPGAHQAGSLAGLYAIDLAALAIVGTAGALALGRIRALRGVPPVHRPHQRAWFLAASGIGLSALSVVLVVGLVLPKLLLAPGAEP
jgi:hypothetical protein